MSDLSKLRSRIERAKVPSSGGKARMKCNECGNEFNTMMGPKTIEVACPKCEGVDTDVIGRKWK